jgi:hypothetical protein
MNSIIRSDNFWKSSLVRGWKDINESSSEDVPVNQLIMQSRCECHGGKKSLRTSQRSPSKKVRSIVEVSFQLAFLVQPSLFSRIKDGIRIVIGIVVIGIVLQSFLGLLFSKFRFQGPFLLRWRNRSRCLLLRLFF